MLLGESLTTCSDVGCIKGLQRWWNRDLLLVIVWLVGLGLKEDRGGRVKLNPNNLGIIGVFRRRSFEL